MSTTITQKMRDDDARDTAIVLETAHLKQDVIHEGGGGLVMMRNVGLVIGFAIECEVAPWRVGFFDFNNFQRISVSGQKLQSDERGFLVPLSVSKTDLHGAIFASVINAGAQLQIVTAEQIKVWQYYYDPLPFYAGRGPVLPVLSLSSYRKITDDTDEILHWSGETP